MRLKSIGIAAGCLIIGLLVAGIWMIRRTATPQPAPSNSQETSGSDVRPPDPVKPAPWRPGHSLGDQEVANLVLAEGVPGVDSTVDAELVSMIRTVAGSSVGSNSAEKLTIDYPSNESIFPPEFVPPTFLWHDDAPTADTWLIEFLFSEVSAHLFVLAPGAPAPAGEIDRMCVTDTNEVYQRTAYQTSAKSWTPSVTVWEAVKNRSVEEPVEVIIRGFNSAEPAKLLSHGKIAICTSQDPVGAPIFYRDVPLAPSTTQQGVIKPLSDAMLPLIAWRLRDVSKPESRVLVTGLLTCVNCHSFSADGQTLGMDLDGPANDKGSYVIVPLAKESVIDKAHVITWNSFPDKPKGHKTIGFLSRMSPDGQYCVTTLNESVYVNNFADYRFLQVFFPTRGILGYYRRATGEIKALPGADDPDYVHCDPVWDPEGKYLVFARASARDAYPAGYTPPKYANDPAETAIQYDLYRMPFDDGRGGKPEPIAGASGNGMSNNFPKISPDGKWIVFVKCRNGQLMRPDSQLWIVPASGGEARLMCANTPNMNSWHSFSPNSRWMVFSSKFNTPYTQMFLTHIGNEGNDSPAILIPNSTAANRAVNIPEFLNRPYDELVRIDVPAVQYLNDGMRGIKLFEKGKLDEAMVEFRKAIANQPDYLEGHVSIAVILIEKGKFAEAIPHLEKALALDVDCWFAHANLGIIRQREGKLDEAIGHFAKAVALQPQNREAKVNLGRALAERGRLDEATVHFRAVVEMTPEDATSRVNLGYALLQQSQAKEARPHFEKAVQLDPRATRTRLGLGEALLQCGELDAALNQFRAAWEANPADPAAVNGLAWVLATCPADHLRDGATAVRLSESACQATGFRDPVLLRTLAAAYAEVGMWPQAVAAASRNIELLAGSNAALLDEMRQHLQRYQRKQPIRSETR